MPACSFRPASVAGTAICSPSAVEGCRCTVGAPFEAMTIHRSTAMTTPSSSDTSFARLRALGLNDSLVLPPSLAPSPADVP